MVNLPGSSRLSMADALSGKESWDLRSQGGDIVAPGLYIYVVESNESANKCIGKFAIVR